MVSVFGIFGLIDALPWEAVPQAQGDNTTIVLVVFENFQKLASEMYFPIVMNPRLSVGGGHTSSLSVYKE
jgi:hypothetical protein